MAKKKTTVKKVGTKKSGATKQNTKAKAIKRQPQDPVPIPIDSVSTMETLLCTLPQSELSLKAPVVEIGEFDTNTMSIPITTRAPYKVSDFGFALQTDSSSLNFYIADGDKPNGRIVLGTPSTDTPGPTKAKRPKTKPEALTAGLKVVVMIKKTVPAKQ